MKPKVALIVPVWINSEKLFKMTVDCIESMQKTTYQNYKIIIVDDCSPLDKFDELVKLFASKHIVVKTQENGGSTRAVNYGIKFAKDADFIQYQNNDTLFPDKTWLDKQMKLFEDPNVGIVGSLLRYADGKIQHAGACWRAMGQHFIDHIGQFQDNIKPIEDVPFVTGCGMTIRREILEKNGGGFTVFEGYGWDDIDIELKAKKWGYLIKIAFDSEFIHLGTISYKERPELASRDNYLINRDKFKTIPIYPDETIAYFQKHFYLL